MFKNILQKNTLLTKKFQLKKLFSLQKNLFSTASVQGIDVYPDMIVNNLKTDVHKKNESEWVDVESSILENIHFFDADQFVDMVSILSYANKGSDLLWDSISRKIFDYEFDLAQTYMLDEALSQSGKGGHYIDDQIARDCLVWEVKWPNQSKVFKRLLH